MLFEGADVAGTACRPAALGPFVVGIAGRRVSGFVAIWALLRYVRTHSYDIFVLYRLVAAAVIVLGLIATGRRSRRRSSSLGAFTGFSQSRHQTFTEDGARPSVLTRDRLTGSRRDRRHRFGSRWQPPDARKAEATRRRRAHDVIQIANLEIRPG